MLVHCIDSSKGICDTTAKVLRDEGQNAASLPALFVWDTQLADILPTTQVGDWCVLVAD